MITKSRHLSVRLHYAALAALAILQGAAAAHAESRPVKAANREAPGNVAEKRGVEQRPENARARGTGPLFAVVMGPGPSWKKGQPLRKNGNDSHWRYWHDLHKSGVVESAGPVGKDTGFVLFHARNQSEANAMLAGDPAIKAGRYRAVARPYDETMGD